MTALTKLRAGFRRTATSDAGLSMESSSVEPEKQDPMIESASASDSDGELQRGVQDVESVTQTWSKWALIAVLINIWFLYFVNAFQSSILSSLLPYVTSDFEGHSQLNLIYIVADSISAAVFISLSKIMDVWGRAEGFAIMAGCATLGLIMMASCNGLASFCAAYVFYTVGFSGMTYTVDVITADVTSLRNRALAYAFTSSPWMITAFAGANAAQDFLDYVSWRWGFGCFAIIFPIVSAPLFFIMKFNLRKAKGDNTPAREKSGRNVLQSIWFYAVEFDALGVLLFSVGLVLFFLQFDIASSAPNGWATGYIIAMLVVGLVVLIFFGLYETYLAPKPMLNYRFLTDRTVIAACLLDVTYTISYYCWDNYFTSFLQVVNDLSVAEAGYVNNTFSVVSGVLLFVVGLVIRKTGRFKWLLYGAVPLYVLAQGLMIYFRRPGQSVGYLVMCQVFISIGGSIFIIVEQIAILAAVDHQHVAAALALLNVVGTVGSALGSTICGAIWTNTFEKALARNLPASALPDLETIYEDIDTQLSYAVGSLERLAIQKAYGYAQTRMLAAGLGIMSLAFIWMFMFRNIDLHKRTQTRGTVF